MDKIKALKHIIKESTNIVFFGGAGVSVPSGIPDFRGGGGLGEQRIPFEMILSRDYFLKNPELFFSMYKKHLLFPDAKPNDAHYVLADLEQEGKVKAIITQNIDDLHQKAGSKNVIELHGSVYRNYCMSCAKPYDIEAIIKSEGVPYCKCGGIIRPDVVLYQEQLKEEDLIAALNYISSADVLIVSGSSLVVFPAAGLIRNFKGKYFIIINKSKTDFDAYAELVIYDSVDKVLRAAVT